MARYGGPLVELSPAHRWQQRDLVAVLQRGFGTGEFLIHRQQRILGQLREARVRQQRVQRGCGRKLDALEAEQVAVAGEGEDGDHRGLSALGFWLLLDEARLGDRLIRCLGFKPTTDEGG